MKTALFVMVPHVSHYYPTFGLASALQKRGFRIVYTVAPGFEPVVRRAGFECVPMQYDDEFVIRSVKAAAGLLLKNLLDPSFRRQCYRAFRHSVRRLESIAAAVAPDLVLLDDTLGHYYPALPPGTRVVQLSTKLSPRKRAGIPPLNCYRQPQDTWPGRWLAGIEWRGHLWKRQARQWLEHIIFLGWSSAAFRARYMAAKGLDREQVTRREMSFYDGVAGVPSVVLAPPQLEFPQHKPEQDEYYIHFPVQRDETHLWSPEYERVLERITAQKRTGQAKIVYVSLGTLAYGNYRRAEWLLKILIDVLGWLEDVVAVVATGSIRPEGLRPEPHVHLLPVVPQVHLLAHCDLMITHGGLGTVKECLQAGVPMLVYPLNEEVDQPGNSARVVARGWGRRGSIGNAPARIRQQVRTTLQQLPAYREKCRQAQLTLHRAEPEAALDRLLAQLALPTFDSAECLYNVSL